MLKFPGTMVQIKKKVINAFEEGGGLRQNLHATRSPKIVTIKTKKLMGSVSPPPHHFLQVNHETNIKSIIKARSNPRQSSTTARNDELAQTMPRN